MLTPSEATQADQALRVTVRVLAYLNLILFGVTIGCMFYDFDASWPGAMVTSIMAAFTLVNAETYGRS